MFVFANKHIPCTMPTQRGGRIRPHERETNNEVVILGADVDVLVEHSASVRVTERQGLTLENKRNYRNRIKHIYLFWKEAYPGYYAVGVRELSEEELADEDVFWWKNKHDLVYEGLNVKMVKAFLAHRKIKGNGKTVSYVQLRKYGDAILYGAESVRQRLPET